MIYVYLSLYTCILVRSRVCMYVRAASALMHVRAQGVCVCVCVCVSMRVNACSRQRGAVGVVDMSVRGAGGL